MQPPWTETLARPIRDRIDGVTLRTRDDARGYIEAVPTERSMTMQWHVAWSLLMAGADAEAVTCAIELALKFEARLDEDGTPSAPGGGGQ
jgi:hypothetical protein